MSRTQSSIKNLITALIGQLFGILISFFSRIVFLHHLSAQYLGLNGLFGNILAIFSLAELGVGTAMNFSLYKPLAEHDIQGVKSLMMLYRRTYIMIGCVIAGIGLMFTPFYTVFLDETPDVPHLTLIYLLFTANTVISYFFSYKRALIICDEKRYIATIYRYVFYFVLNIAQVIALIFTDNYILYLTLQIIFTFAENVAVSVKANEMYPFLKDRNITPISKTVSTEIKKNIGAMLFHKIGGIVVMSTDNLILSKYVGLIAVGIYSNYYLITDALNKIIAQIFTSVTASVGNLSAIEESTDKIHLETAFYRLLFLNFWIYGFSACCLWILVNPFISLWLGSDMLFDKFTVLIIVINFYLTGIRKSVLTFREATGAFYYDRYKPLIESLVNIVASIVLAKQYGTAGVFLGTIISTLTTCIWIEPYVLYKYVFQKSANRYINRVAEYIIVTFVACIVLSILCTIVNTKNLIYTFVCKMALCMFVPNIVFWCFFFRLDEFRYFARLIKGLKKCL